MFPPLIRVLRSVLLCLFLQAAAQSTARTEELVRVKVLDSQPELSLRCQGYCRVIDSLSGKTVAEGAVQSQVKSSREGILWGERRLAADVLSVVPEEGATVILNARTFRGELRISAKKRDRLTVVNCLGLEDYLKGISVAETSHYWPMEALRAQAVVFRSYALYQKQRNAGRDYDLSADVSSQVYAGKHAERYRFNEAVIDTRGEVLQYDGQILPAFFHSTCGGHTQDASELWSINSAPLAGVPCLYCQGSPHYNWKTVISAKVLSGKLFAGTRRAGQRIMQIGIVSRNASGRVKDIRIRTENAELIMPGKDFRSRVGADSIRSTNFNVSAKGASFVFEGLGWGHGAGLCQWGAYFLAKSGADYKEILAYYYPHSTIATVE